MKRTITIALTCALICTLFSSVVAAEVATIKDGTITVTTQTGVNKYIDNDAVQTMILKTESLKTITIPDEEGAEEKTLIIDDSNGNILPERK